MRLIDVDELLCRIRQATNEPSYYHTGEDWFVGMCAAEEYILESPVVAVIPYKMNDADEDISPEYISKML